MLKTYKMEAHYQHSQHPTEKHLCATHFIGGKSIASKHQKIHTHTLSDSIKICI